ncbi:MAG: hypothetical protein JKY94_07610 [Rhodobacteraceae bacterium]|nr:hypothetical protein [Paracoccaceae bacterium]
MTDKLCVAIVLTNAESPSAGECRLLDALRQKNCYQLTLLSSDSSPVELLPLAIRAVLTAERSVLKLLRKIPVFTHATGSVLSLDQFSDIQPPPDLVVDFSGLDRVETLAQASPFGMWRLDAYSTGGGIDAAFLCKVSTLVNLMQWQGNGQPPEAIAQAVYDTKTLAAMNAMYIQEKSVQLIERELARLTITLERPYSQKITPPDLPRLRHLGRYLLSVFSNIIVRVWQALMAQMGGKPGMFEIRVGRGTLLDFNPVDTVAISVDGNRFLADPFLIENNGETFLFYEDFNYDTDLGHIGVGKLDGTKFEMIGPAYIAPHHLSFPFVFRHGDDIFMLPETYQANRLEIWRAVNFPTGWELYSTSMEGVSAVDSVLSEINGEWWLFTNICRDSFNDHCAELHIFRTDGPAMTKIEPHALNPVVIGSDTARGGGRIFCQDGRWYRVSQDNSGGSYGYGLNIMEIEELDLLHYHESRIRHITPDFMPGLIGCHQFDAAGGLFVIDTRKP